MLDVQQLLLQGQFALSKPTILEVDRDLDDALAAALHEQLETDLVPDRLKSRRLEGGAPQRKEAAMDRGCW